MHYVRVRQIRSKRGLKEKKRSCLRFYRGGTEKGLMLPGIGSNTEASRQSGFSGFLDEQLKTSIGKTAARRITKTKMPAQPLRMVAGDMGGDHLRGKGGNEATQPFFLDRSKDEGRHQKWGVTKRMAPRMKTRGETLFT